MTKTAAIQAQAATNDDQVEIRFDPRDTMKLTSEYQANDEKTSQQRAQLIDLVEMHYNAARMIENALKLPSRIRSPAEMSGRTGPVTVTVTTKGGKKKTVPFEPPRRETIMHDVWSLLQENPNIQSFEIRDLLGYKSKTDKVKLSTALHSLLKHHQIVVSGKRGSYRYSAVTADNATV